MPSVVLAVPGLWKARADAIAASREQGLLWAGEAGLMMDAGRGEHLNFELYPPDQRLALAFKLGSGGRLTKETLDRLARHTMTVYLVAEEPASAEVAARAMRFARALLDAGGLAVKAECSGVAHGADEWRRLCALPSPELAAYHGLTLRVREPKERVTYSSGLHQLGLPDAVVPGDEPAQGALLDLFGKYLLLERPRLADGHTFSEAEGARRYRLHLEPDTRFPPDDLFHNPFGRWRLEPL